MYVTVTATSNRTQTKASERPLSDLHRLPDLLYEKVERKEERRVERERDP